MARPEVVSNRNFHCGLPVGASVHLLARAWILFFPLRTSRPFYFMGPSLLAGPDSHLSVHRPIARILLTPANSLTLRLPDAHLQNRDTQQSRTELLWQCGTSLKLQIAKRVGVIPAYAGKTPTEGSPRFRR
jgi:hypothetical protein